jgi:DNA helicase-2/ATP-dependent DNA helicase PcrA
MMLHPAFEFGPERGRPSITAVPDKCRRSGIWQPPRVLPSSVSERLDRLAPDQREAATAPPGPVLCVAPAGSGKTTTLVARIGWLVATGADPATITAVTFNKRAADEMASRVDGALEPLGLAAGAVRVKTFHALGREILADGGESVEPLLDREAVLRDMWPEIDRGTVRRLDDAFSRLKLEIGVTAREVATDPDPGPIARAFLAYESALDDSGGLDFDDLVARALRLLEARPNVLRRWRAKCGHLLVDETQDVDRTQLKLALLLAAPQNRIFLVGDDDQTIYGWRLADVRRVLALADELPGLRRIDLTVNYRCPKAVVERAVRLVSHNDERFDKIIRACPTAAGNLILAPDGADEMVRLRRVIAGWPDDGGTRAVLARTNAELLPAAAVALELGMPFRAPRLRFLSEDRRVDAILAAAEAAGGFAPAETVGVAAEPGIVAAAETANVAADSGAARNAAAGLLLPRLAALAHADPAGLTIPEPLPRPAGMSPDADARDLDEPLPVETGELLAAVVAWAAPYRTIAELRAALERQRELIAELRRDDALLTLATAHSTKGLEFDHVAVIGLDAGRFPSGRSLRDAPEPARALEEERRLAYVAWTRARRTLTLVYDPASPSPFMLEAFSASELGLSIDDP